MQTIKTVRVPESIAASAVIIERNAKSIERAALEYAHRDAYMLKKGRVIPVEIIKWTRISGLVLERHVVDMFERRWNRIFRPADNDRQWSMWSNHDFKLALPAPFGVVPVDVSGPRFNDSYGLPKNGRKQCAFLHLLVRGVPHRPADPTAYERVIWFGVVRGQYFDKNIDPSRMTLPSGLISYLDRCSAS